MITIYQRVYIYILTMYYMSFFGLDSSQRFPPAAAPPPEVPSNNRCVAPRKNAGLN